MRRINFFINREIGRTLKIKKSSHRDYIELLNSVFSSVADVETNVRSLKKAINSIMHDALLGNVKAVRFLSSNYFECDVLYAFIKDNLIDFIHLCLEELCKEGCPDSVRYSSLFYLARKHLEGDFEFTTIRWNPKIGIEYLKQCFRVNHPDVKARDALYIAYRYSKGINELYSKYWMKINVSVFRRHSMIPLPLFPPGSIIPNPSDAEINSRIIATITAYAVIGSEVAAKCLAAIYKSGHNDLNVTADAEQAAIWFAEAARRKFFRLNQALIWYEKASQHALHLINSQEHINTMVHIAENYVVDAAILFNNVTQWLARTVVSDLDNKDDVLNEFFKCDFVALDNESRCMWLELVGYSRTSKVEGEIIQKISRYTEDLLMIAMYQTIIPWLTEIALQDPTKIIYLFEEKKTFGYLAQFHPEFYSDFNKQWIKFVNKLQESQGMENINEQAQIAFSTEWIKEQLCKESLSVLEQLKKTITHRLRIFMLDLHFPSKISMMPLAPALTG